MHAKYTQDGKGRREKGDKLHNGEQDMERRDGGGGQKGQPKEIDVWEHEIHDYGLTARFSSIDRSPFYPHENSTTGETSECLHMAL